MFGLIAALLAALTLSAAGHAGVDDLADVKARGVLRVLVVEDKRAPEFFSLEPGHPPGFDAEVLESFARAQAVRLEPVVVAGWDDLIPALEAGKGDLIAGRFTATEVRRAKVAFTIEVFPTREVVLTRKPQKPVQTLAELRTLRVGTVRGSTMAAAVSAARVPPRNVDDSIPPGGLPDALAAGKVQAVVIGVERALICARQDGAFEIGLFVGGPASLAYGIRRGDTKLLAALNEHLRAMAGSTAWSRLTLKYFGQAAPEILRRARSDK